MSAGIAASSSETERTAFPMHQADMITHTTGETIAILLIAKQGSANTQGKTNETVIDANKQAMASYNGSLAYIKCHIQTWRRWVRRYHPDRSEGGCRRRLDVVMAPARWAVLMRLESLKPSHDKEADEPKYIIWDSWLNAGGYPHLENS